MEIRLEQAGGTAVAYINGEADADNCDMIGQQLLDSSLLNFSEIRSLNLDLGELSFIDSSAVSELLRVRSELADQSVELKIVNTSDAVHRVLEITGLLSFFGIES